MYLLLGHVHNKPKASCDLFTLLLPRAPSLLSLKPSVFTRVTPSAACSHPGFLYLGPVNFVHGLGSFYLLFLLPGVSFLSVADSFWTFRAYLKQLSSEGLSLTNQLIRVFNQPSETYYFLTLFFCITLFTILSLHFLLIGFFLHSPTREEGSGAFLLHSPS